MTNPNVVVSSAGVFHSYPMARGAVNAGYLKQFITTNFSRYEKGIPLQFVTQIRPPGYLSMAASFVPNDLFRANVYHYGDNWYDRMASRRLPKDIDIFHFFNHQGLYSLRVAQQQGATVICDRCAAHPAHQHQILAEEYARFGLEFPSAYTRLHQKMETEFAESDYVMVCSDFVKRSLIAHGVSPEKMLPNTLGFDPTRFGLGPKEDDVFRVMYAGGISLQKGIPYLLEAFKQLNLPNSELVLVGNAYPEASKFLPQYEDVFKHIAFVPQTELGKHFQQASVFVMPSMHDGFGMVVYEAAACGIPLIITDHTGADIRCGQDGFIVPAGDVEALKENILYLYENPEERIAMGRSAHDFVQQFTWQNYERNLINYYDQILA